MKRQRSALQYVLLALVPFTDPNLKLAFHPNRFFLDLERISGVDNHVLRAAHARAMKRNDIVHTDSGVELSLSARQQLQPFIAKKIKNGMLMVIFDIPEDFSHKRRTFRAALRRLQFSQVQQSVWMTQYDHRDIIAEVVRDQSLEDYVEIYEAAKIEIS